MVSSLVSVAPVVGFKLSIISLLPLIFRLVALRELPVIASLSVNFTMACRLVRVTPPETVTVLPSTVKSLTVEDPA